MKTLKDIQLKLSKLKPLLEKQYAVSVIGVFGSFARNEQDEQSDLDILVEFNRPIGIEFIDLADFLEQELELNVDLVSRKGIKPKYLSTILSEIIFI